MTWVKTNAKIYEKTGRKVPVFLWPNSHPKRVFLDVKNGKVQLEYSYDPVENYHPTGQDMQWQSLESGLIENDFAFEMNGIHAMRLRVIDSGDAGVALEIFEKKAVNNEA
jgi:hypothetical protein